MLKVISRALRAKEQAARVQKRARERARSAQLKQYRKDLKDDLKAIATTRRTARSEEKEDRRLGPLKPRRAFGKDEIEQYGAIGEERFLKPKLPWERRRKYWNVVVGDRVVVLRGVDKHKIGVVKSVDKETGHLIVAGLEKVPKKPFEPTRKVLDLPKLTYEEFPIPYTDVRLVVPLPNPETGILQDTIVANIKMSPIYHNRHRRTSNWNRYIQGTDICIPWPKQQGPKPEKRDEPCDTRIMNVELGTFVPSLLRAPFPEEVVDELRNKYSKFRIRHDEEYIAKKEAEDRERIERENMKVRTPVQELNRAIRMEKKAMGPPVIREDVLEMLGRAMVKARPELLEGVGHTKEGGEEARV